jgi:hypothetical protein
VGGGGGFLIVGTCPLTFPFPPGLFVVCPLGFCGGVELRSLLIIMIFIKILISYNISFIH